MLSLINPFAGPIGRAKWWGLQVLIWTIGLGALFVLAAISSETPAGKRVSAENLGILAVIASVIYANFCTCLARLRDTGRSGWWYVSFLLPTVGTGLMIWFCGVEAGKPAAFDIDDFEDSLQRDRDRSKPRGAPEVHPFEAPPALPAGLSARQVFSQTAGKPAFGRR